MNRLLLPAIYLALILSSCKKKNDIVPINTISATINGVQIDFHTAVNAIYSDSSKKISLFGFAGLGSKSPIININISANNLITVGTYESGIGSAFALANPNIIYSDTGAGEDPAYIFVTDASGSHPSIVNITSISSFNVQGTFRGVVARQGNQFATITNGKFNVNIQPSPMP
jgi:hypothetical protein